MHLLSQARWLMGAVLLALATVGLQAQEAQPGGTVKISSTPMDCIITFRGNRYEKDRAVLTFNDVPPGQYTVDFSADGLVLRKSVVVRAGETSILFANVTGDSERTSQPVAPSSASDTPISEPISGGISPISSPDEEADTTFRLAELLRDSRNPFLKPGRYRQAEDLYKKILEKWPRSDKVEMCHYRLGEIFESVYVRNYSGAIDEYKKVIEHNFDTPLDVRYRIGLLYEKELGDKKLAIEWYELAARYTRDETAREEAVKRAEALKKKGY